MSRLDVSALASTLTRLALRGDGGHAPELDYALTELVGDLSAGEVRQLAHAQAWLTAALLRAADPEVRDAILTAYELGASA